MHTRIRTRVDACKCTQAGRRHVVHACTHSGAGTCVFVYGCTSALVRVPRCEHLCTSVLLSLFFWVVPSLACCSVTKQTNHRNANDRPKCANQSTLTHERHIQNACTKTNSTKHKLRTANGAQVDNQSRKQTNIQTRTTSKLRNEHTNKQENKHTAREQSSKQASKQARQQANEQASTPARTHASKQPD